MTEALCTLRTIPYISAVIALDKEVTDEEEILFHDKITGYEEPTVNTSDAVMLYNSKKRPFCIQSILETAAENAFKILQKVLFHKI